MRTLYYAIPFCWDSMVGPYDSEAALMSNPLLVLDDDMWPVASVEVEHSDFMDCDTIVRGRMTMRDDDIYEKVKAKYDAERGRRWLYPPIEDDEGPFNYEDSVQLGGVN